MDYNEERIKSSFFKPCRVYWWNGFYIPVRNDWSFELEYRHLSVAEKERYESKFGAKLISSLEFDRWMSTLMQRAN